MEGIREELGRAVSSDTAMMHLPTQAIYFTV
jgi:hypothetical protein